MSLTQVAVLLLAAWLIIWSQTAVSSTFSLIVGIVAAALVVVEAVR